MKSAPTKVTPIWSPDCRSSTSACARRSRRAARRSSSSSVRPRQVEEYLARPFEACPSAPSCRRRSAGRATRPAWAWRRCPAPRRVSSSSTATCPLVRADDLRAVAARSTTSATPALALATCVVSDPTGYGRVLRKGDRIAEVREQRDLERRRAARRPRDQRGHLCRERRRPARGARVACSQQRPGRALPDGRGGFREQRRRAGRRRDAARRRPGRDQRPRSAGAGRGRLHQRIVRRWRLAGATVREGARIEAAVTVEQDVVIETGAVLRGDTTVARGAGRSTSGA